MKKLLALITCLVMALVFTGAVFAGGGQEEAESTSAGGGTSNLEASLALDEKAMALKAEDGQPLLILAKETRKVPKPVMVTLCPFLREVVMLPRSASSTSPATFLVTPVEVAAVFTKSCLVIGTMVKE